MVATVTTDRATIWVAARDARIRARYWSLAEPAQIFETKTIHVGAETRCVGTIEIEGLGPDRRYAGRVIVDESSPASGAGFAFRTAPPQRSEVHLRILTGSCAFLNDPKTDDPKRKPYGGDPRIYEAMAAQNADLMLWLGDNVYYRDSDLETEALMRRRQLRGRRPAEIRGLLQRCSNIGIWDDHDFGPNDSDMNFAKKALSLEIFRDFWPNPGAGLRDVPGVFFRHRLGDVEIFATDGRYHRSPNDAADGPEKTMLGEAQLAWLVNGLAESDARFKLVVFGSQVLNPICNWEGMGKYAFERKRLLNVLATRHVKGVFFLSGDRHHSELIVAPREGRYPLYDLTVSPLLSGTHGAGEAENPARVEGSYLTDVRNFAVLDFEGRGEDRRMVIRMLDLDGHELYRRVIRALDLQ